MGFDEAKDRQCLTYPVWYDAASSRKSQQHNNITTPKVEIRSSSRLPPDRSIRVSCHTLDEDHVKKENTVQLKCAEDVVTQNARIIGSDLGYVAEDNDETCPTKGPVPAVPAQSE